MKKIIYVVLVLVFTLVSCSESFLDRGPEGMLHEGNTDIGEIESDLLARGQYQGGYAELRSWRFAWPAPAMHNYTTPDAEKGSSLTDGPNVIPFKALSFTTDNGAITDYYQGAFATITQCNEAIELASLLGADKEKVKNEILAEAMTLRAAMYFRLTQAFGPVPYINRVLVQGEKIPARFEVETINKYAKADLEWSIPYLTTRKQMVATRNLGKLTQNMARAILAKMAIYQKDWNEVIKWTGEIITSGDNDLSTPYDKIFTEEFEYGAESIFEIFCDEKPLQNIFLGSQYAEVQGIRGTPNLGWGFNAPSTVLMNAFETGDPRKTATVISAGDVLDGVTIIPSGDTYHRYFNKKLYTPASERGVFGRNPDGHGQWVNIRIIRYSDIVLMYAEAACELGMIDEALAKLEMVRERARGGNSAVLPKITERDSKKLMDKIRHERRIELALEFERYFDLVRWGIAKQEIPHFTIGKNELYPIPQIEIEKANGILTQNPGY